MKLPEPRKLPSGRWNIRVMVDGRSKSITKPTKKECIAAAAAYKTGLTQIPMAPADRTLAEAYDIYIQKNSGRWSPSTLASYLRYRKNYLQGIMRQRVGNITQDMIQREVDQMLSDGLSRKTVANATGLLHAVLKDAKVVCPEPPNLPRKSRPPLREPTTEDVRLVLQAAKGGPMELPILLAAWMGLRLSEIRGLKPEDIQEGKLHICRAVVDDSNGRPVEKPPKTFSGSRWITLPPYIQSLIPDRAPGEYLVQLSGQAIYKRLSRLQEKAGVQHYRFHDLRRVNAAVMIALGIDSKYARQRCGWQSDHMYKDVYGYVMPDTMSVANQAIDDYFCNEICNAK